LALSADVADAEAVEEAASLDTWINNAMATVVAPLIDTRPEEFKRAT
jgi:hypothetical protein